MEEAFTGTEVPGAWPPASELGFSLPPVRPFSPVAAALFSRIRSGWGSGVCAACRGTSPIPFSSDNSCHSHCVFEVFCLYWTVRAFGTGMVFLHFCTPVTDTYNREHPWGRPFLVEVPSGPTTFPGEGPLFHVLGLGLSLRAPWASAHTSERPSSAPGACRSTCVCVTTGRPSILPKDTPRVANMCHPSVSSTAHMHSRSYYRLCR